MVLNLSFSMLDLMSGSFHCPKLDVLGFMDWIFNKENEAWGSILLELVDASLEMEWLDDMTTGCIVV